MHLNKRAISRGSDGIWDIDEYTGGRINQILLNLNTSVECQILDAML